MIKRGIQYCNQGKQTIEQNNAVYFNKLVLSWVTAGETIPPIRYQSGIFSIANASNSDYLVSWMLSISTATKLDHMDSPFFVRNTYLGGGDVTEGCFSSTITSTGIINGFKVLHVNRKTDTDLLTISLINRAFYNTVYLTNPGTDLPSSIAPITVNNATICICSL